MSSENTIRLRSEPDGRLVEVLADGSIRPYVMPPVDWARLDAMTDAEIEAQIAANPDAAGVLTDEELDRGRFGRWLRQTRERLGLSQATFAERFHLPLADLQAWEQGHHLPEPAVRAYLTVIEREPAAVTRALAA